MNEQKLGITGRFQKALEATADLRKKDRKRKPLPNPIISRRTLLTKGVPASAFGIFTVTQFLKNPFGLLELFSPKKATASEGDLDIVNPAPTTGGALEKDINTLENQTINEGILGIGFTTASTTMLRVEPKIDNTVNPVARLPRGTEVVIKSSTSSMDQSDGFTWYEVDVFIDDPESTPTQGFIREDVLDVDTEFNFNNEIYANHGILLGITAPEDETFSETLAAGIENFVAYAEQNNIPFSSFTVRATSDQEKIFDLVMENNQRNNFGYVNRQALRNSYQHAAAMAEPGKMLFVKLSEERPLAEWAKIIAHEATHAGVQENLLSTEMWASQGRVEPIYERLYGPTIISEGYPEFVALDSTTPNWRQTQLRALDIQVAPKDLITPNRFLNEGGTRSVFSYGAYFCAFLEDLRPGGLVDYFRRLGEMYEQSRTTNWRAAFEEIFEASFDNISDEFMEWKNNVHPIDSTANTIDTEGQTAPTEIPTNLTQETRFVSIQALSNPFVFNLDNNTWEVARSDVFNTTHKVQTEFGQAFKGTCGDQQNVLVFEYQVVSSSSQDEVLVSVTNSTALNQEVTVGEGTPFILAIVNQEGAQINALTAGTTFRVIEVFEVANGQMLASIEIDGRIQEGYVRVDDLPANETAFIPES